MKINEIKHNHSLTDLLKVLLFSILMLLPFLDVGTRCAYVIANKNAYQSYSGKANEYVQTPITRVELNQMYHFDSDVEYTNTSTQNTGYIGIDDVSNVKTNITGAVNYLQQASFIRWYYANSVKAIYYFDSELNQLGSNGFVAETIQFDFRLTSYTQLFTNFQSFSILDVRDESYVDNVFEYSVNKLESSNLYNWTTQTAIYSGVSQMTTQLGITGNIIPIILCYWFFITIIYIILDIVIKLFTILTHFIGSKTSS